MVDRTTKLRWRRRMRRSRRQVEDLGVQAEEQIEQHFFKRLNRLATVRRFVASWVILIGLLIGGVFYQLSALGKHYQSVVPVPGGTLTEGILGSFTNANPLYATGPVDSAVSRLLFAGLLKYDEQNALVGDLAESWTANEAEKTYTVVLRPNLKWQDGEDLTADDVVFTYKTIQNPDARSPFFSSWQKIQVEKVNARTIRFTLPSALASFPHGMTNGIVPKHLLESTPPAQLRSIRFDTVEPIGSGPFKLSALEVSGDTPETRSEQLALVPNEYYYAGRPKLQQFKIKSFLSEKAMLADFEKRELTSMSGLTEVPDTFAKDTTVHDYNIPLTGEVGVFFRTTQEVLQDVKVRQALVQGVDQNEIIKGLGYPVRAVRSPLLPTQMGSNKDLVQLPYDTAQANKLLDEAGWVKGKDGIRTKNNLPLSFGLYAQNTSENTYITQKLQSSWRALGVDAKVLLQSDSDLQTNVAAHNYDALLYGISIGTDPDVFAYWHSSQGDSRAANRVNFSEYRSVTADRSLEAGRNRADPELRAIKYRPFLQAWRTDAPALMLYQPRYLYISREIIYNLNPKLMNRGSDRYANVHNWMIRTEKRP